MKASKVSEKENRIGKGEPVDVQRTSGHVKEKDISTLIAAEFSLTMFCGSGMITKPACSGRRMFWLAGQTRRPFAVTEKTKVLLVSYGNIKRPQLQDFRYADRWRKRAPGIGGIGG